MFSTQCLPKAFGLLKTTELLRRLFTTQVDQQAAECTDCPFREKR